MKLENFEKAREIAGKLSHFKLLLEEFSKDDLVVNIGYYADYGPSILCIQTLEERGHEFSKLGANFILVLKLHCEKRIAELKEEFEKL